MHDTELAAVGVVGTGVIGASWAAFYAVNGLTVRLWDEVPSAAAAGLVRAMEHLDRLRDLALASEPAIAAARTRLSVCAGLDELADGLPFIHEAVRETYEAKLALFAQLDALTPPETILASSTSGLLMRQIQTVMQHPERSLTAHPFNPPHLVPLVELVPGPATDEAVVARVRAFYERLGKVPVVVRQEVPGHLANRLAAALWREAIDLVANGVATVEDVDKALSAGPGLRWAVMGQHLIYHLGGGDGGYRHFIEHIGQAFEEYWRTMPTWTAIPEPAKEAVIAGVAEVVDGRSLSDLAAERDRRLAGVLRALADPVGRVVEDG